MAFGDVDLPTLFELGVTVVYGAQNTNGWFQRADVELPDGGGLGVDLRRTAVVVRSGSLTSVLRDTDITVDGLVYKVRDVDFRDDGKLMVIEVAKL